ncbi:ankyrin repeat domain-containing protein, chloroplastic-like [Abrus precatorius]|uniref:Ankyrin repeat domain-containing protein, chloroplastic-like n=1 Tax=Abrus precatorius TaxID=3816 RepID=A0A8B8LX52_ABRPR|nr:ankyrin repeat domain-containing protein, chloroplastic-like [Abrus precatorius]
MVVVGSTCSCSSTNLAMFQFSTVLMSPLKLLSPLPSLQLQAIKFPRKSILHPKERGVRDCVVFEEGIFENDNLPISQNDSLLTNKPRPKSMKKKAMLVRDELVPDKWRETHAEINDFTSNDRRRFKKKKKRIGIVPFMDKERHKKMEMKNKVEMKGKRSALLDINWNQYRASKKDKLTQLNPLVLDNPSTFSVKKQVTEPDLNGERVEPKNPRGVVYGKGLEYVNEFFNSGSYNPTPKTTEGRRKLFTITKEEVVLLNKRTPDLAAATSGKWLPLHTFAACGELYLLDSLLKHNADIYAVDKDGLTVLHKAIGKKLAVTDYLLRNSANPSVLDKEGATVMHYAVQTASAETIELLLLYNVDINLQDNDGWTPLHLAVQTQKTDLVRLLLIKGADKTLRNKDGLTPLDLCLYSGQSFQTYELIKLFKQPQGHLRRI